jgi:hypothetical protein
MSMQVLKLLVRDTCCCALQLTARGGIATGTCHIDREERRCCALVVNADGGTGLILVADSGECDGFLEAPLGLQDHLQSQQPAVSESCH